LRRIQIVAGIDKGEKFIDVSLSKPEYPELENSNEKEEEELIDKGLTHIEPSITSNARLKVSQVYIRNSSNATSSVTTQTTYHSHSLSNFKQFYDAIL
jgi:hypothetical protein